MNEDRRLELINRGKESEIVLKLAGDKIHRSAQDKLNVLKSKYRGGQIDQATLQSGLAAICALDDLYAELVKDVTTGNSASKELHGHSERKPHTDHTIT